MAPSTFAHVTPEVLRWARESVGYDLVNAAARISVKPEKLEAAESGELMLTLRQAERAAYVYDRPLAALFMPEPPREEPQEAQFRRLPGAPSPPWPPEMQLLARRVQERQEDAVDLYEALNDAPQWVEVANQFRASGVPSPETARELLGIGLAEQTSWRDPSGYMPLRKWIDAVEMLGVLVMQDGSLPVELMRPERREASWHQRRATAVLQRDVEVLLAPLVSPISSLKRRSPTRKTQSRQARLGSKSCGL